MINSKGQMDKNYRSIINNFEVSLVMPFYKKLHEFSKILPLNAPYFQRNGVEVIIVMDESTEVPGLMQLIKHYPFINWKVLVNYTTHEPRNPAKVLNVGIRCASKKYIMVSSPETRLYTDVMFQLRNMLEYYQDYYAIGTVAFIQEDTKITKEIISKLFFLPYGSFMTKKKYLEMVTGYDESFEKWGGDDDNIRKRLDMIGIRKLFVPESISLHMEKKLSLSNRLIKSNNYTPEHLRKIDYPNCAEANTNVWGNDFSRIEYNWQNKLNAEELCHTYLSNFIRFKIRDNQIFQTSYKKLILCQAHNETGLLKGFLENMATYFDGIILLDDGSTDGTYEAAKHEKLLLKVEKAHNEFNDLKNRNILLNIASFFRSEWLCFMDIDERFDERFADFHQFTDNLEIDVATFCFVHLWDFESHYNTQYPYTINGLFRLKRMFRNTGRMQINTPHKKLHFEASPLKKNLLNTNILVKHMGNITKDRRIKRYNLYNEEDTYNDQHSYEHLLVNNPILKRLDEITLDLIVNSVFIKIKK